VASPQRIARVFQHGKMPDKGPLKTRFAHPRFST
jgi:hypothetical protein